MQDVKKDRYKFIGGSDIPIMGLSSFKTRFELLLEKAQLKDDEFDGNEYTEYGNIMEPKIRQYVNTLLQRDFQEGKIEKGDVRCHFDGIDDEMILEIKTTSHIYSHVNDYGVYLVQLLFYMIHSNKNKGILAVYERPADFNETFDSDKLNIYTIDINDYMTLCYEIMEDVQQFRIDLEKLKENPFLTEQDLIETSVVELANDVIKLEEQMQSYKELEKRYKEFLGKLKTAMEQSNIKKWETPNGTKITLVEDSPSKMVDKFNEEKFKEENAELYQKYVEPKEQKGKSGYVKITLAKKEN